MAAIKISGNPQHGSQAADINGWMTTYKTARAKITGVSPLVSHNIRCSNPLDPLVKEIKKITSRRKKVDQDLMDLAELEWQGGLYLTEDMKPCIPGLNIEACLVDAAKSRRLGKTFKASVFIDGLHVIKHDGPDDLKELQADPRFRWSGMMGLRGSKILRCMPMFPNWSLSFELKFQSEAVDPDILQQMLEYAGENCGLGTLRPRHGRFMVESFAVK